MPNVITIDGPASSGKDSVGSLFAAKINYQFIDTGAIYRAGAYKIFQNEISSDDESAGARVFKNLNVEFKTENGKIKTYLDGKDVTDFIYTPQISDLTAKMAAYPAVRKNCSVLQRQIGQKNNTVMAGRDIGSEIFPEAKLKFYLTARPEVRARRRFDQLVKKYPRLTFSEVLEQTIKRDKTDSERLASPLRIPEGSVVVDTTNKNIEESVEVLMENYQTLSLVH